MHRGLGLLAQADQQQPLGGQAGRGVQQQRLVGAGLVFAAGEHGGRGGLHGRVGGQQHGLGLGVGAFGGLCVGGQHGQQFGFDSGKMRKRQLSSSCSLSVLSFLRYPGPSAPHAVLAGVDGGAGFAVGLAAAFGFALVPVLLALGHGQLALHPSVAEVKPGGDERVALDLRLGE